MTTFRKLWPYFIFRKILNFDWEFLKFLFKFRILFVLWTAFIFFKITTDHIMNWKVCSTKSLPYTSKILNWPSFLLSSHNNDSDHYKLDMHYSKKRVIVLNPVFKRFVGAHWVNSCNSVYIGKLLLFMIKNIICWALFICVVVEKCWLVLEFISRRWPNAVFDCHKDIADWSWFNISEK